MAADQDPQLLSLSIVYSKLGKPQSLSYSASLTGLELKEKLREPLGISADSPLVLTYQNGSRNAAKKLLEDGQSMAQQGIEDGATITVKVDAVEVRPENSFLRESIRSNGTSSYYYAHANEKELPPEVRYVYGGEPIKLESEESPKGAGYADSDKVSRAKPLAKYSWADEGDFVCIYIAADGEAEAIEVAGDGKSGQVEVQFGERSVELRIAGNSKEFALCLRSLEGEIVPEESKHRVSAGKRVTLKMKKKRPGTWTRLMRPK
eukprot:TRINITY_DN110546_c0_g1_i1.p1 TRINITY_DN110546_c0_g1~~TRINITY_DN110546_c0_g1_i1.p1  ORF type:complete len:263 (+),score=54.03 TRINITY_DN110546_c0_g1_i1:61-849(+)